jgi:hypothetical protein
MRHFREARQSKAKEAKEEEEKTIKHTFQKKCFSQTFKKKDKGTKQEIKKEVCLG